MDKIDESDECDMKSPQPEEIKKEIEEFMREKFGDDVHIIATPMVPKVSTNEEEGDEKKEKKEFDLAFNHNPKDVKEFLDKYVIRQDQAKKALAIAVCDHYNHVRSCHQKKKSGEKIEDDNYSKQNVLMLGPTGVGKTYLVRMIAKLIGVPFVKADATRFTETGYVGANVDDMLRDLVSMADNDIELAQYGIIYLDEVDKLAGGDGPNRSGKDVSGRGVQYGLLKLMEETEVDLSSPFDMLSQIQGFMDFQKDGKVSKKLINTKHILFIVSGSFSGMDEIIKRRLRVRTIGLKNSSDVGLEMDDVFQHASTKDLIDFGFEPEFIGRLPIRVSCQKLKINDLYEILKNSKGSIIHQYVESFKSYGIDVVFEDDAFYRIAELAYLEETGARALMTVCEKIFRDFKFELPSTEIKKLVITKELVDNSSAELERILNQGPVSKL